MKTTSEGTEYISKIKEARIKHGLTQQQVSNITGVPFRSIQNWEAGVRKCPDYVEKMVVAMIEQTGKVYLIYRGDSDDDWEIIGYIVGTEQNAEKYCDESNKDYKHPWEEVWYKEIEQLNK